MSLANVADQQRQLRQGCERCGAGAQQDRCSCPTGRCCGSAGTTTAEHKDKFAALGYTVVPLSNGKPADSHPLF
jgi:hypothetical protein